MGTVNVKINFPTANTMLFLDKIFNYYRISIGYVLFDFVIPPYAITNSVLNFVST